MYEREVLKKKRKSPQKLKTEGYLQGNKLRNDSIEWSFIPNSQERRQFF